MKLLATIGALWCAVMHESPMWPFRGAYKCRTCHRKFNTGW